MGVKKDSTLDALIVAKNHVDSARWVLKKAHPIMDSEETCVYYEFWAGLGEVIKRVWPTKCECLDGGHDENGIGICMCGGRIGE